MIKIKKYLKLLILVLIVISVITTLFYIDIDKIKKLKIEYIKQFLSGFGNESIIIYIIIYALKPVILIIPSSILSIASGMLYGPINGTLFSMIGCFLSGTTAFFISRILGKDIVDRILKGKVAKMDNDLEKNGFKVILLLRLFVIFPYDLLSYTSGLSKMKYKDFILGTMIGIFPEMIAYNFLGDNIHNPFNKISLMMILLLLILIICGIYVKWNNRKQQM